MAVENARSQLNEALLEPILRERYWDAVRQFFNGLIVKEEWDARAKHVLGELNVHLHNAFFLAIWTTVATAPPCARGDSHVAPPTEFDHLEASVPAVASAPVVPTLGDAPLAPLLRRTSARTLGKLFELSRQSEAAGLPTLDGVRAAVYLGVREHGLQDASLNASLLIKAAMKIFVKNIFENMIVHTSSFSQSGKVRHAYKRDLDLDFTLHTDNAPLNASDLALAAKLCPGLLSGLVTSREQIFVGLDEDDDTN